MHGEERFGDLRPAHRSRFPPAGGKAKPPAEPALRLGLQAVRAIALTGLPEPSSTATSPAPGLV